MVIYLEPRGHRVMEAETMLVESSKQGGELILGRL
jgi:hypothetical protein